VTEIVAVPTAVGTKVTVTGATDCVENVIDVSENVPDTLELDKDKVTVTSLKGPQLLGVRVKVTVSLFTQAVLSETNVKLSLCPPGRPSGCRVRRLSFVR
jgi:hypothetical protein